mgnify:CR=1 FL=1|jgi:hypothetical protein
MTSSAVLWMLSLHIAAMLLWCGTQVLLLVLLKGLHAPGAAQAMLQAPSSGSLPRWLFTRITTPAALLAIMSGTAVFLLNHSIEVWLLLKLVLVTGLVLTLTLSGALLLRARSLPPLTLRRYCNLLLLPSLTLMLSIVWTVLTKPFAELLP